MLLRLLEKSFELKTQDYEKQIRFLKEEMKALKDEKMQLQRQLEGERVTSDGLKGEVARLSKQAKVGAPHSPTSSSADSSDLHEREELHIPAGSAKSTHVRAESQRTPVPPILPSKNPPAAFDLAILFFYVLKVSFLTL